MMLRFAYLPVPLRGAIPATLPANASAHWRPLVPVRVINPTKGVWHDLDESLLDIGADDCLLPSTVAQRIRIPFLPDPGRTTRIRWRGSLWTINYADVLLSLNDGNSIYTWPARVALSSALLDQPILGRAHCLQFFDGTFRGLDQVTVLEPNGSYPGTIA